MKSKRKSDKPAVRAIVLCAGSGVRTGLAYNKLLHVVGRKTVLETTLDSLLNADVCDITVVASERDEDAVAALLLPYENIKLCRGGKTRTESARNGLNFIEPCDIVVIHDGARPFTSADIFRRAIESARDYGSGIAAVSATDTVKEVSADGNVRTLNRKNLYRAQTPQAFDYRRIKAAYDSFDGIAYDDSQVYELGGYTPRFVEGSEANRKITTADDFYSLPRDLKIGIGYDVHALGRDRRLVLGGTVVDYDRGLVGHSDADVLTHAVMDALLSAAGLPDIGVLFPDTDPSFKNADSIMLLKRVRAAVSEKGFSVSCVSAVIAAQKPKLMSYIPEMRKNIADALQIAADVVNVSATTTEGLGIVGEERGMAASASCLLKKEETERGKNN